MAIRKCEKCELNYVKDDEKYCKVCQKLLSSSNSSVQKAELCPSCGERLVAKGYELCSMCLSEMLDITEKIDDETGDTIDTDITPADMEITAIEIDDDSEIIIEDETIPDEIKHELEEEDLELFEQEGETL